MLCNGRQAVEDWRRQRPDKFVSLERIFTDLPRGARIFLGTACAEPQFLVSRLLAQVQRQPKTLLGAELYQVWTLGVAPYADERLKDNFRHNSFFIGSSTRRAVNRGMADYTPIFLSRIPRLFQQGRIPLDIALVQASPPDSRGYMSLGIGVDIVKAAVEVARRVVVQVNSYMPRVHGDGFIHIDRVDNVVHYDEPLLEYRNDSNSQVVQQIGNHVARLVHDGDTFQVGYGSIPDAILSHLCQHRHLGVHTELITPGVVELMRRGVVDNSRKKLDRGKSVATFCMGNQKTYEYIHDNPEVSFRTVDYTNNPLVIARHDNMVAINSALEIDLTGQATAESIGRQFYSGIGGQADFMRGAIMARNGRTILAMASTAEDGQRSRIVPFLQEGAGATLNRGDIYYVVTEYGIAYLHGKNIRQRAMELIAIAHPRFRPWLLEQARSGRLVYEDQRLVPGEGGYYPRELENYRTTSKGVEILLRPVKISDESLLKDFFYSLSDNTIYKRFMSSRPDMPHERLQQFVVIDYTKEMVLLAVQGNEDNEKVVGMGQYIINGDTHMAEAAVVVRDDCQGQGIGEELLRALLLVARQKGLHGFFADVLAANSPMLKLVDKLGMNLEKHLTGGVCQLVLRFGS